MGKEIATGDSLRGVVSVSSYQKMGVAMTDVIGWKTVSSEGSGGTVSQNCGGWRKGPPASVPLVGASSLS
jgi:hypothetical protein